MFGAVAMKAGVVECQAAGERLLGDRFAVGIARRVAVAAGHDGIDEIIAALGRRFRQLRRKAPLKDAKQHTPQMMHDLET